MSAEEALRKLREADAGRCAPSRVEAVVLDAFRHRPKRRLPYLWAAAAAAILIAVFGIFWMAHSAPHPVVPRAPIAAVQPAPVPLQPAAVRAVAHHHQRPRRLRHAVESGSVVSQFVPVPYAPPLPSDEIRIMRVRVEPAAFGIWAVSNEVREADVVAGADGIVRAVRWVR